jgi:hypothetical protein
MLRTIFAGLKGSFNFEQSLIERVIREDEVDQEILRLLFETDSLGLFSKDLAAKLERFKMQRFQVSRRISRMNKRTVKEFGEKIAEKRGWHWSLTIFQLRQRASQRRRNSQNRINSELFFRFQITKILSTFHTLYAIICQANESSLTLKKYLRKLHLEFAD